MSQEEEKHVVYTIPTNFRAGLNVFGINFKPLYFFEGVILGAVLGLLFLWILASRLHIPFTNSLGFAIVFAAAGLIVGIRGINDEPVTSFIKNLHKFRNARRSAYFNPRVKQEAISLLDEQDAKKNSMLPRDRILAVVQKYKNNIDERNREQAKLEQNTIKNASMMFFEDDIGYVDKPLDYMTPSERKAYFRKLKKEEKKKMKGAKRG